MDTPRPSPRTNPTRRVPQARREAQRADEARAEGLLEAARANFAHDAGRLVDPAPRSVLQYAGDARIVVLRRRADPSTGRVGVGLKLQQVRSTGDAMVVSLTPGGAANESGQVAPGDILHEIDNEAVRGEPIPRVVDRLKGAEGSTVILMLQATEADAAGGASAPPHEVTLVREGNANGGTVGGVGLGLQSDLKEGVLISAMAPHSAAASSGRVTTGDRIVAVDGTATRGKSVMEVIELIRGPVGTSVTLTLQAPAPVKRDPRTYALSPVVASATRVASPAPDAANGSPNVNSQKSTAQSPVPAANARRENGAASSAASPAAGPQHVVSLTVRSAASLPDAAALRSVVCPPPLPPGPPPRPPPVLPLTPSTCPWCAPRPAPAAPRARARSWRRRAACSRCASGRGVAPFVGLLRSLICSRAQVCTVRSLHPGLPPKVIGSCSARRVASVFHFTGGALRALIAPAAFGLSQLEVCHKPPASRHTVCPISTG